MTRQGSDAEVSESWEDWDTNERLPEAEKESNRQRLGYGRQRDKTRDK